MQTKTVSKFSHAILFLTMSDVFTWGVYTVLTSITGIYLSLRFGENTVMMVGTGVFIYMLTRGLLQIPAGKLIDSWEGWIDEIVILFVGSILMALQFLFFPFITMALHYFVLQFIFGIGVALNLVSWRKLFAGHLSKNKEGQQYAFYEMTMSIFMAFTGLAAGSLATISPRFFDIVIVCLGLLMLSGSVWALFLLKLTKRKVVEIEVGSN